MANRTDPEALPAHGNDPQLLIEKMTRDRVYESRYWQERCFGQSVAGVVHLAVRLRYCGGAVGVLNTPSPFLCLVQKLLQLGPEPELVDAFLEQSDFKYARILAAFYVRLVDRAPRVYKALEPLLADFRKLVIRDGPQSFSVLHVDEVVEMLLQDGEVFGVKLPRLQTRSVLIETGQLEPRVSALPAEDLAALDDVPV